jgi:hypothetical protein
VVVDYVYEEGNIVATFGDFEGGLVLGGGFAPPCSMRTAGHRADSQMLSANEPHPPARITITDAVAGPAA